MAHNPQHHSYFPPPPPGVSGDKVLPLPRLRELDIQYRPRSSDGPVASSPGGNGHYDGSAPAHYQVPRHDSGQWAQAPSTSSAPVHLQQQAPSRPDQVNKGPEYSQGRHDTVFLPPGVPLSSQSAPPPGSLNSGPSSREELSQGANKRSRELNTSAPPARPHQGYYQTQQFTYGGAPPPSYQMSPLPPLEQSNHPGPYNHAGYAQYSSYAQPRAVPPPAPSGMVQSHQAQHAPGSYTPAPTSEHWQQQGPQQQQGPPPGIPPPPPSQHHQPPPQQQQPQHHQPSPQLPPPQPQQHQHQLPPPPPQQYQPQQHQHQHQPRQQPQPQHHPPPAHLQQQMPPPPPPPPHHQQSHHMPPPQQQHPVVMGHVVPGPPASSELRDKLRGNGVRSVTVNEIRKQCDIIMQFASRYMDLQRTMPNVQPSPAELIEMADRAVHCERLFDTLVRTGVQGGITREEQRLGSLVGAVKEAYSRPPKRPWEEMNHEAAAPSTSAPVVVTPAEKAPRTAAEQDMEMIRNKRASTTGTTASGQPKSKYRKRSRATPPGKCHSCNIRETPEWRRGPDGARTLCNACGLHFAKLMRKRDKATTADGQPPPPIDMATLRASTARAHEAAGSGGDRAASQSQSQPQSQPPTPAQASFPQMSPHPSTTTGGGYDGGGQQQPQSHLPSMPGGYQPVEGSGQSQGPGPSGMQHLVHHIMPSMQPQSQEAGAWQTAPPPPRGYAPMAEHHHQQSQSFMRAVHPTAAAPN